MSFLSETLPIRLLLLLFSIGLVLAAETSTATTTSTTPEITTSTATPNTTTSTPPFALVPVYRVINGTDICLLMQMNLKFEIRYQTTQLNEQATAFFYINGSSKTELKANGTCGPKSETLKLEWWPEQMKPAWQLLFQFDKTADNLFSLNLMQFNFTTTEYLFPDINETSMQATALKKSQFSCAIGSYFQCLAKQTWELASIIPDAVPIKTYLTVSDLKVEAFRTNSTPAFLGTRTECSSDYVPNKVVPIVVGVALACMIVIALVAFIVASRRRQSGYQTI